jgi:hypothetical protein
MIAFFAAHDHKQNNPRHILKLCKKDAMQHGVFLHTQNTVGVP